MAVSKVAKQKFFFRSAPDNIKTHVVSFSGGRTSAYLVNLMEEKRKKENWNVKYIFMDTGAEDEKTYEFIKKVVNHYGIDLICLKAEISSEENVGPVPVRIRLEECGWDLSVWRQMLSAHSTPYNPGGAFCTDRMKTTIYRKFCNETFGPYNYHTWLGIRTDEPKRLKESKDRRKFGTRYLAEISDFEKTDILKWWEGMPFDLELEEWLGNCIFCIKKGINKVALAAKDRPEKAEEFWRMINESSVRESKRKEPHQIMYRGRNSLYTIQKIYEDAERHELISALKGQKRDASGSCSESCEVPL